MINHNKLQSIFGVISEGGHYSSGPIFVFTTRQKNFVMTASSQHIKTLTILRQPLSTMYFTP